MSKKLDNIFNKSRRILIDDNSKIVIMSDCHRGAGNNYDNFIKNQNIFEAALASYYKKGFVYIELGDGDELWEVEDCKDIVSAHLATFEQLKKFNDTGRLIMIYGNHDIVKKTQKELEKCFYKHYNTKTKEIEPLLDGLVVYESLVLKYNNYDIFLLHGHQVDFLNDTIWKVSRFLVRYLWKPFEHIGLKDPTSAAKNNKVLNKTEEKLKKWSIENKKILISGHTHNPIFPQKGERLYFNDGSCLHPDGITCLEIENGKITLAVWKFRTNKEDIVFVKREVLESEPIVDFFK